MDRTCVSTGRSPETSGPSSPECTDPNVATARRQPRHDGVLRARLLRPAGRHAMVVAHFFESGQRRRLRWASRERTANGRRSSAGQHRYIAAIDEKAWAGTSARPGVQGSHSVSRHCHETAREQSTRGARSSHPLERGLDRSPVAPRGQL